MPDQPEEERATPRQPVLVELRRKIAIGLEQAKRGELLDGEEVFDDLERRHGNRSAVDPPALKPPS